MKSLITAVIIVLMLGTSVLLCQEEEEEGILTLQIGNSALKTKTMTVPKDAILSGRTGNALTFEEMIREMKDSRFIYVGETHNSLAMHDIQHRVISALFEQDRNLSIGLEMFPFTMQEVLNRWSLGLLTKEEFIREARWYVTWNFNFKYYEKIFDIAKKYGIPIYALNMPRETVRTIRMQGWDSLPEEMKGMVPEPDLTHEDHRALMKAIFGDIEMPHAMRGGGGADMMFEGLYRAQTSWDETMGYHAVQGFRKDGRRMVVLAGSGHLMYNLGINLRVSRRVNVPFKTVICLPVAQEEDVNVSRSYADYVWGIPTEDRPAYPSVGLALKKVDGMDNLIIERDPINGVARGQDFKKGDVLLGLDGHNFFDINEMRIYLSRFTWGDEVKIKLLREGEIKDVALKFEDVPETGI